MRAEAEGEETFICEKCGEVFLSGWALGGHASRVHPGESEAYRRKIRRREERAWERDLLSQAKRRHHEVYGPTAPINRVKIRKFKRELRAEMEQERQLSAKVPEPAVQPAIVKSVSKKKA